MRAPFTCCAILLATVSRADPIPAGRYAVDVHLVIPHVDTKDYDFTTEICLAAGNDAAALGPLSPGPLARCPREGAIRDGALTIRVQCTGGNAGFAIGSYQPIPSGFRGRVEMNMGGKNMTLAEEQRGRYLGACQ